MRIHINARTHHGFVVRSVLCACLGLAMLPASGVPPATEGYVFESYGLPWNDEALIRYLSEGLPELVPVDSGMAHLLPVNRWKLYEAAVNLLGSHGARGAVPVLTRLMDQPLPNALVNDAIFKTAASTAIPPTTWEDWDRELAADTLSLKLNCADALHRIDAEAAVTPTLGLLDRYRAAAMSDLRDPNGHGRLANLYGGLCRLALEMGRPEGVDALASLLPLTCDKPGRSNVPGILNWLADAPDLPEEETGNKTYEQAVRQWLDWWAAHGESYVPRLERPKPDYVYPPPEGAGKLEIVRGHIVAALDRGGHGDLVVPVHPEAAKWLKVNAAKYAKQLRSLAEAPDQPASVRSEAAEALAGTRTNAAYKWLRKRLLKPGPADSVGDLAPLLRFVQANYPERYGETIRACVEQRGPAAEAAVRFLMLDPSSDASAGQLVLEKYSELVKSYPGIRFDVVQRFFLQPATGDEVVFFEGIQSGDPHPVMWSAQAIYRRGLEDKLPPDARKAYDERMKDPYVRLSVMYVHRNYDNYESVKAEALDIVRSVEGTDAAAASAFAQAYDIFTCGRQTGMPPEGELCLKKLRACVAAYRASRGGK